MSDQRMPHSRQIEDVAVARMRRDLTRPRWWQTVPGRLAVAGGCVALLSAGVSAVVLLAPRTVDDYTHVQCMEGPYRHLDGSLSGTGVMVASPEGVLPIEDAIAVCEMAWKSGAMDGEDPLNPTPKARPVPEAFTVCVADDATAVVVPGRVECSTLRLHPYHPSVPSGR